jgi:prepilin-type N-terminal cleavage/methylation domain-containing protein
MRRSNDRSIQASHRPCGFTLVELLVAVVAGAALMTASALLLSQDLITNHNLERFSNQRRQVTRARNFLELEASNATRLNPGINSFTFTGLLNGGTTWTTTYEVVAAGAAGVVGVTFRGPFVLRRTGLPYDADGRLDLAGANQVSVVLDQIANNTGLTVTTPSGESRGARVAINLVEGKTNYAADFSLVVPIDPNFGLLTSTWTTASPFSPCPGSPAPAGCRLDGNGPTQIQEWHVPSISGNTITPVGNPPQVVVYFNAPRPTAANAIRGTTGDTSSTCTRSGCYVVFGNTGYTIGSPVNQLVFTNAVLTVARS